MPDDMLTILKARYRSVIEVFDQGYDEVLFLGADQVFFDEFYLYDDHADVLLVPHAGTLPPLDNKSPSRYDLLRTGVFNSDIVLWRNKPETRKALEMIDQAIQIDHRADFSKGLFYDQTFLNLLPGNLRCEICNDPSVNYAFYNMHERELTKIGDRYYVNGYPLVSTQFSGFTIDDPKRISRHQNRLEATGVNLELMNWYASKLAGA